MKNILIIIVILLFGGLAYYFLIMRPPLTEVEVIPSELITPTEVVRAPDLETRSEPVFEPELEEELLSKLEQKQSSGLSLKLSDPLVLESLSDLLGEAQVLQNLVTENVIARTVATIDALTSRQLSLQLLPISPPDSEMEVTEDTDPSRPMTTPEGDTIRQYLPDPVNDQRYVNYVELLESVETEQWMSFYLEQQDLYQQAYVELGYPQGDFNERLLEVIDHLLDTPEPVELIRLIKPEAYYLFADPDLEALSAGQKLLIRMGSRNAQRVKAKLDEMRTVLEASNNP